MELASLIVAVVAALLSVGATTAAWRAVRPRPVLAGRIVGAWQGPANEVKFTLVGVHVLLTNRSTHPVYPVGAALEVKIADEWYWAGRLARYQVDELAEITITDGNSGKWAFRVSPEHVTALLESRVEHGAPLAGLLVFHLNNRSIPMIEAGGSASIDEYRLVITDVFGKKHSIEADRAETETFSSGDVSLVEMLHETGVPSRRVEAGTDNGPAPD